MFRTPPLEGAYPYLWLDAKHVKVREHGRVVSKAAVAAYAVHESGVREVIGLDVGEVKTDAFWVQFVGDLKRRADRPKTRQRTHDRRLPRHDPAAAGLRRAEDHQSASDLDIDDLQAPLIGAFLEHLEHERGNTVRTRNAWLAAIRALFRYAALKHPEHAASIQRVLAIPIKRHDQALVTFLTDPELQALLDAPDQNTRSAVATTP